MAVGGFVQELRVVLDLSFKPIEGASPTVLTVVHVDLNVGEFTIPAELVETFPTSNEAVVQPALQFADPIPEAVLDGDVVGLHVQYYA